jgi:hypothetical protein
MISPEVGGRRISFGSVGFVRFVDLFLFLLYIYLIDRYHTYLSISIRVRCCVVYIYISFRDIDICISIKLSQVPKENTLRIHNPRPQGLRDHRRTEAKGPEDPRDRLSWVGVYGV